jgi:hypothetical protein
MITRTSVPLWRTLVVDKPSATRLDRLADATAAWEGANVRTSAGIVPPKACSARRLADFVISSDINPIYHNCSKKRPFLAVFGSFCLFDSLEVVFENFLRP